MNINKSSSGISSTVNSDGIPDVIAIHFDQMLLDTLRARHNSRYSRSEAFIDLLWRMRDIDSAEISRSAKSDSKQMLNHDNTTVGSSSVQQPSLFQDQDRNGGGEDSASQESSQQYSGRATDEFMSRHCLTNYSQLAAAWHWNRQTVLTFLRSLESAGVILFEQKNKTVEIYI